LFFSSLRPKRGLFVSWNPIFKPVHFAKPAVTAHQKADSLRLRKGGRPIRALTAYDYPTARLLDECGVDLLLVGDSLGMVVLGFPDTTHVTLDHMLHHVAAVARARPAALVVGDLPIHSYDSPSEALATARKLVAAGAEAVKLEGGIRQAAKVSAITAAGIPVIGHLGMLPQRVLEEGGYRKKGKTPEQADALREGAEALIDAGVSAIVLESIVPATARVLSECISVPTIGIGCGDHTCDGEIAVITDLLGSFPWFVPPFAKPEADIARITREAVKRYVSREG
jgi:3-methyl-2-oxobutanoate hydroxymethyltransferase